MSDHYVRWNHSSSLWCMCLSRYNEQKGSMPIDKPQIGMTLDRKRCISSNLFSEEVHNVFIVVDLEVKKLGTKGAFVYGVARGWVIIKTSLHWPWRSLHTISTPKTPLILHKDWGAKNVVLASNKWIENPWSVPKSRCRVQVQHGSMHGQERCKGNHWAVHCVTL